MKVDCNYGIYYYFWDSALPVVLKINEEPKDYHNRNPQYKRSNKIINE